MSTQQQDSSFGVVIYDTDGDESRLERAITSLRSVDYDKSKISILINSYPKRDVPYLMNKVEDLKKDGFNAYTNINISPTPQNMVDYAAFSKVVPCDYLMKMSHDAVCPQGVFSYINDASGYTMFGGSGVSVIPLSVVDKEYLNHNDYEAMAEYLRGIYSESGTYKTIE